MKKFLLIFLLLYIPTCVQAKTAKTIYVSIGETTRLPSGSHWKSQNKQVAKIKGKKIKGIKKGKTALTYVFKRKKRKITVVVEKPYFSASHIGLHKRIRLLGTKRKVEYCASDWDLIDDMVRRPQAVDNNNVGGGIITLDARVGNKTYSKCLRVGNILPYELMIKKGKKKKLFDGKTMKKINLSIHVQDPSIVSVTKKGVVTGKRYGATTIWLKYKGKKYCCKVFCLPAKIYDCDLPYSIHIRKLADYRYVIGEKAYRDLLNHHVKFQIQSRIDLDNPKYKKYEIMGLYSTTSLTITGKKYFLEAEYLVHEVGHFLDDRCLENTAGWYSDSDSFRSFCKKFIAKYPKRLTINEEKEIFADLYMEYVLCPYRMRAEMPMAYHFMNNLMGKKGYSYNYKE